MASRVNRLLRSKENFSLTYHDTTAFIASDLFREAKTVKAQAGKSGRHELRHKEEIDVQRQQHQPQADIQHQMFAYVVDDRRQYFV
jgi:hypothetical protein